MLACLQASARQKRWRPRLRGSASNSPSQCRHLDEEREAATGRKKTSPGRQSEGQITPIEAPGKKTLKKEEALALNPEENAPKNTGKPWFSNRQLSTGFGTMLTAENVVRCQAIESARLLGAELAERTAEGFRSRTSQTIALLANRLDAMAMDGGSANEIKSIAATLRDVWTVGKELHGLSTDAPEAIVSVNVLGQLTDRNEY